MTTMWFMCAVSPPLNGPSLPLVCLSVCHHVCLSVCVCVWFLNEVFSVSEGRWMLCHKTRQAAVIQRSNKRQQSHLISITTKLHWAYLALNGSEQNLIE